MVKQLSILVLCVSVYASAKSAETAAPPADAGVRVQRDVAYLPAERSGRADLYFPAAPIEGQRLPAVVIIHGGGFKNGDKARRREANMGRNLAQRGYVGMSINYKLAASNETTWPQCLHDAKTAVRWLRKNADRLQIDADHIGAIGSSAGGTLAAMLAVSRPEDKLDPPDDAQVSCQVSCAVDFYGPVDLLKFDDLEMLVKTRAEAPELYRAASPLFFAHRKAAPLLIVHGTADKTVDLSQSRAFAAALEKVGAEHELVIVVDAPHSFDFQPQQQDLRPKVFEFFDRHLKPSQSATSNR